MGSLTIFDFPVKTSHNQCAGRICELLLTVSRCLLYMCYLPTDGLLSLFVVMIAQDEGKGQETLLHKIVLTPFYILMLLMSVPVAVVFLPLRCILLYFRKPYRLSVKFTSYTEHQSKLIERAMGQGKYLYGIASGNLCLAPEIMSRLNQLKDVGKRSKTIGERIVTNQFFNTKYGILNSLLMNETGAVSNLQNEGMSKTVEGKVMLNFPFVDFLLLQETWSNYYCKPLLKELHKIYPYIVHDAGVHSFQNNRFLLNSGLLIASRHPVAAVDFKPFSHFIAHAKLFSQGLLMMKV